MEVLSVEMQHALIELWRIQEDIQTQKTLKGSDWIEEKLRELLQKVRQFVDKYGPQSYTVGVGIPWGANVSFTWSSV